LSVADTGCGMNDQTMKRLFEPFFTTKEVGQGPGLGLATVRGIVHQHQGWVEVESRIGKGSTFRVYLPAVAPPAAAPIIP
jgi:signal transduction histidine kinase